MIWFDLIWAQSIWCCSKNKPRNSFCPIDLFRMRMGSAGRTNIVDVSSEDIYWHWKHVLFFGEFRFLLHRVDAARFVFIENYVRCSRVTMWWLSMAHGDGFVQVWGGGGGGVCRPASFGNLHGAIYWKNEPTPTSPYELSAALVLEREKWAGNSLIGWWDQCFVELRLYVRRREEIPILDTQSWYFVNWYLNSEKSAWT